MFETCGFYIFCFKAQEIKVLTPRQFAYISFCIPIMGFFDNKKFQGKGRSAYDKGNRYAPASSSAGYSAKKELDHVEAIKEKEHFHLNFLKAYPDATLNCVKDYKAGPTRLQPEKVNKFTTALNSEWKRRIEFATSFTAASVRALHKMANTVPAELVGSDFETGDGSVIQSLILLRKILVDDKEGQEFVAACEFLDSSNEIDRNTDDLAANIKTFFKYFATKDDFHVCLQLMVAHGATLMSGAICIYVMITLI